MKKPKIFLIDVDGVLTTGQFLYTENGKTMFIYQAYEAFKLWHKIEPKINRDIFKLLDND